MLKKSDLLFQDNKFWVTGDLDFFNVMPIFEKSVSFSTQCSELIFDFSRVSSSNSAGLALIMEWIRLSKQQNKPIQLLHVSPEMRSLAKAAGLEALVL